MNINNLLSSIIFLFVLLGLFVMNIHQANHKKADDENLRRLQFSWLDSDFDIKEWLPKRDYQLINLTGNEELDCIELNKAQLLIKDLINSKDKIKGVQFNISDTTKFWAFIEIINICLVENAKTFVPDKNTVWVLNY